VKTGPALFIDRQLEDAGWAVQDANKTAEVTAKVYHAL
jgi:type I site-specific restriction endonuclease